MITLQRRHLAGHDILLARHGNHICSMRVDRGNDRVIALLDDGSVDSAPNIIAPGLRLPETIGSVMREDWKLLTAWTGIAVVTSIFMAGAAAVLGTATDPATLEIVAGYTSYANTSF